MPGGAPAVEEGAGSFAVGRGGGSRCVGPARFPALAASVRAPEGCRGGRYRVAGPGGNPLCAPRSAACPRAPPSRPDPLCAPVPPRHPAPQVPTRSVPLCTTPLLPGPDPLCSSVSRSRPVLCRRPPRPGAGARPAGAARGWRAVLGSWCGGLGAAVAAAGVPVGAVRVKWDTGGTHSHSRCGRMGSASCSRAALL